MTGLPSGQRAWNFGPPPEPPVIMWNLTAPQIAIAAASALLGYLAYQVNGFNGLVASLVAVSLISGWLMYSRRHGLTVDARLAPVVRAWLAGSRSSTWATESEANEPPPPAAGWTLGEAQITGRDGGTSNAGLFHDDRNGSWVIVCRATTPGFDLLDTDRQERLVDQWANALRAMAEHGSPIDRVQWIERITPYADEIMPHWRHFADRAVDDLDPGHYADMFDTATDHRSVLAHETYVALKVTRRSAGDRITALTADDAMSEPLAALFVLHDQARTLDQLLPHVSLDVLDQAALNHLIRTQCDPFATDTHPSEPSTRWRNPWPEQTTTEAGHYQTDGTCHVSAAVSFPARDISNPGFLRSLLYADSVTAPRTVSTVFALIPPDIAAAQAARQSRDHEANDIWASDRGERVSAVRRLGGGAILAREAEAAHGHAGVRLVSTVHVTGRDSFEATAAMEAASIAARQAEGMSLRILTSQQDRAFIAAALPTAGTV